MDIEELARLLRKSQGDESSGIFLPWDQLDDDVHEYYRQQARYVQEHALKPLEDHIKVLEHENSFLGCSPEK
jgi:hypothetical protein